MDDQAIKEATARPPEAAPSDTAPASTTTETAASDALQSPPEPATKVAVENPAAKLKKPRVRRGPPPAGMVEKRLDMILTTSRLSDADGRRLRRGQAVSVPERRVVQLTQSGKVRRASQGELDAALRRHGPAGRIG